MVQPFIHDSREEDWGLNRMSDGAGWNGGRWMTGNHPAAGISAINRLVPRYPKASFYACVTRTRYLAFCPWTHPIRQGDPSRPAIDLAAAATASTICALSIFQADRKGSDDTNGKSKKSSFPKKTLPSLAELG